jgi:phage shock protein C
LTDQPLEPEEPTQAQAPPPPPPPPPPQPRRLYRSRDDQVLAGVCGGLAEYFEIDSTLVRIAFVLLVFAGGIGILAYGLAWIFLPEEPVGESVRAESHFDRAADAVGDDRRSGAVVLGLVFVAVGILFLLDIALPDFLTWRYVWPIALIAVGLAIVFRTRR